MNMKNIFCCLLPGLLFGACANKVYEETGDSVILLFRRKNKHLLPSCRMAIRLQCLLKK